MFGCSLRVEYDDRSWRQWSPQDRGFPWRDQVGEPADWSRGSEWNSNQRLRVPVPEQQFGAGAKQHSGQLEQLRLPGECWQFAVSDLVYGQWQQGFCLRNQRGQQQQSEHCWKCSEENPGHVRAENIDLPWRDKVTDRKVLIPQWIWCLHFVCSYVYDTEWIRMYRHRWTGRYEAHLWDNSCRREGQSRKGRQGNVVLIFEYLFSVGSLYLLDENFTNMFFPFVDRISIFLLPDRIPQFTWVRVESFSSS